MGGPAPHVPMVDRFTMASRRDAVAAAVDRVLDAVAPAGLDPSQREDLAVAVAEALANAAVHGNRLDEEKGVAVVVTAQPGMASVEVTDGGNGFDVTAVEDPTADHRVLAPGGRGLFLMRRLVDRVEHNAAGNRVRLTALAREPK